MTQPDALAGILSVAIAAKGPRSDVVFQDTVFFLREMRVPDFLGLRFRSYVGAPRCRELSDTLRFAVDSELIAAEQPGQFALTDRGRQWAQASADEIELFRSVLEIVESASREVLNLAATVRSLQDVYENTDLPQLFHEAQTTLGAEAESVDRAEQLLEQMKALLDATAHVELPERPDRLGS